MQIVQSTKFYPTRQVPNFIQAQLLRFTYPTHFPSECGCGAGDSGCSICGCCKTCAKEAQLVHKKNAKFKAKPEPKPLRFGNNPFGKYFEFLVIFISHASHFIASLASHSSCLIPLLAKSLTPNLKHEEMFFRN